MSNFAKDIDLRHNKIKRAKVEVIDRANILDDDAIDAKFVRDVDIYETPTTANTTIQPTNEILDRTKLHGKPTREVFDELFYPIVLHKYVKPTITVSARFVAQGTNQHIDEAPGVLCDVKLDITIELNDSQGIDTDQIKISGAGIAGTVTTGTGTYTISNYNIRSTQQWGVSLYYKTATARNDSRGNVDVIGATDGQFFLAGNVHAKPTILNVSWPYYVNYITNQAPPTGSLDLPTQHPYPTPTNLNNILSTNSGRYLTERPAEVDLVIKTTVPQYSNIFFAIPINGNILPTLTVTKDGGMSVTPSFTGVIVQDVHDATNSGEYSNYAVWRGDIGVAFTTDSTYTFKTK